MAVFSRNRSVLSSDRFRRMRVEPLEDRRMLSVLFVDDDAASGGDGLSWESAFKDLQAALDSAMVFNGDGDPGNDVDQIWIAEGVYKPSARLEPGDVRSASFSSVCAVSCPLTDLNSRRADASLPSLFRATIPW